LVIGGLADASFAVRIAYLAETEDAAMTGRHGSKARLLCSLTIAATVAALGGAWPAAASATSPWTVEPTPVLSGGGVLNGVSCVSATSCTAVGYSPLSSHMRALAEHWNGSAWAVQTVPSPAGARISLLSAVSCASPAYCVAVGVYISSSGAELGLTEQWDGSTWAIQATPGPPGAMLVDLNGVSCFSLTSCTEVGDYSDASGNQLTIAEHWDGSTWAIQPTPNADMSGNVLNAVSCTSATECIAVGWHNGRLPATFSGLAERWRGSVWRLQHTNVTGNSSLEAVSCRSAVNCTAAGVTNHAGVTNMLADHWDGSAWTVQPVPAPPGISGQLVGVSCPSRTGCTAVGSGTNSRGTLLALAAVSSDGTWRPQATASPTANEALNAVSCTLAGGCTAVGGHTRGLAGQPVVEHS
jgi:hypothetical protein